MAVLGYVCMQYPETQLGIILLPFITFSAGAVSIMEIFYLSFEIFELFIVVGYKIHCWLGHSRCFIGLEAFRSCSTFGWSSDWNVSNYFVLFELCSLKTFLLLYMLFEGFWGVKTICLVD